MPSTEERVQFRNWQIPPNLKKPWQFRLQPLHRIFQRKIMPVWIIVYLVGDINKEHIDFMILVKLKI